MLLLMFAFNLPGSHIKANASLADLHKLNRFEPVHWTGPVKQDIDPSLLPTLSREWVLTPREGAQVSRGLVHQWGDYGVGIWPENWSSGSSFVFALPHHCNKKRAEPEGKVLDLLLNLPSFPHLWSWRMSHGQNKKIADESGQNGFPQEGGWCLP